MAIVAPLTFKRYYPGTQRKSALAILPNPQNKSGRSQIEMCYGAFNEFFHVPIRAKDVKIHITKTPREESYKMARERIKHTWSSCTYLANTLDGHEVPYNWLNGSSNFKRLLDEGYKYVSVSYEEGV